MYLLKKLKKKQILKKNIAKFCVYNFENIGKIRNILVYINTVKINVELKKQKFKSVPHPRTIKF